MFASFHPAVSALALFQSTQLNLFERFLTQAVSGIDSTSITSGMQNVAYVVLLVGFLWQIYQSALHGGDVRGLGTNLIKYVITAIVVMNYHAIFTTINQGFVNSGNWINSASGTTNLLQDWGNDLKTQFNQVGFQKLWDLISAGVAGFLDAILIIVAYILYPVVIVIFGFFYILYGSILYIFGPIVIALMPLGATNRLAKSYIENVFIWNAWPVLYGSFGALLSAVQMGQIGQMLNQNDFLGGLGNVEGSILIGLASIIYSLAIAVIPFIAKKIVSGDVGSTAGALIGAAATALTAGVAATEGVAAGAAAAGTSGSGSGQTTAGAASSARSGSASSPSANLPMAAQRNSAATPGQVQATHATSGTSSSSLGSAYTTTGDQIAENLRATLGNASKASSDRSRDDGLSGLQGNGGAAPVETPSSSPATGHPSPAETPTGAASVSAPSRSSSNGRGPGRNRGPSPALMRPHGLATWGAFHAARLATQGAVRGARAASDLATGIATGVTNPVETAGRLGAIAGEVAGAATSAVERARGVTSKAAHAVSNPRETLERSIRSVTDGVRNATGTTASMLRESANAVSTNFSDGYEKARSETTLTESDRK